MNNREYVILQKILKRCEQIHHACSFFSGSKEEFCNNDIFSNSVCKCIEQIGELCKYLSDEFVAEHPEVPWKSWCRIRDRIVHQYDTIDFDIVWDTVQCDVPVLERKVVELVESKQ